MTRRERLAGDWNEIVEPTAWDARLAKLGGHPLQSALWGEARRAIDGVEDVRLACGDRAMARVEARPLPLGGKVAWAPRGPAGDVSAAQNTTLHDELRGRGFVLLVTDAWRAAAPRTGAPRTIWLDISRDKDALMAGLDKQWRYGVRRAGREGVTVGAAQDASEVARFHAICLQVAQAKGFELPGSLPLMTRLLEAGRDGAVGAQLLLARHGGRVAAGAFLMRSGSSLHYFWGATDRDYAKQNVGEAVQWAAIEWGVENGCERYDLEGIDPRGNPGVYAFKRKMGGEEVSLAGQEFVPLGIRGTLVRTALKAREALRRTA